MLKVPTSFSLVKGTGEGITTLNAFDRALLEAGIGDFNLIKVSSIIPPEARKVNLPSIPKGALVPTVYSKISSSMTGEVISACVGAGISKEGMGLLYEFSHKGSAEVAEKIVKNMVRDGFKMRGLTLNDYHVVSAEHKVKKIGCAVCGAVLWWD